MPVQNLTRAVSLTSEVLNLTSTSGIDTNGDWFYYVPVDAGNTLLAAAIKPYKWDTPLTLANSASTMQIEGTLPLINETWEGSAVKYHGSSIEWIGAGTNDITSTPESDAFFFSHLGSLSTDPDDDAFYWDRAYSDINGESWYYYQYHKHLPLFYPPYEDGRQTFSGRGFISPEDKAFGYMINSRVSVMGTNYASVVARVHTPSIGGAHNSHNDVNLPATAGKNYLPGGILKGTGNRFHTFYLSANSTIWDVYSRTYSAASLSFSPETNLGAFDLADPTFNPVANTGTQSQYPFRASAGCVYGTRIYFPVIFNNATSGFDLKIWSLSSVDSIAGGSLQQYTLSTGVTVRPDCHLVVFNDKLYAIYSDIANGGVYLKEFDGTNWSNVGQVCTNSSTKYIRIHGFEHNQSDAKFYALLSGTALGGGTYTGPGMYTFTIPGTFAGYPHLDYDYTNNAFINRGAANTGFLQYSNIDNTLTRYSNTEPAGISSNTRILNYTLSSPTFINRKETILGGAEYYYQGINLRDGRKVLAGRIVGNEGNKGTGTSGDLLVSIYSDKNSDPHHLVWGGTGDDYVTSVFESPSSSKVWLCGYTKSELVEKKDMKIHGYVRNFTDGSNQLAYNDVAIDTNGNMYAVGNHSSGYAILMKFDANYELLWQTSISNSNSGTTLANSITIDTLEEHVYVAGSTTSVGEGGTDAIVVKIRTSDGRLECAGVYGTAGNEIATSIANTRKSGTDYFTVSIVNGTDIDTITGSSTTLVTVDHDCMIVEQNTISNTIVKRVRSDKSNTNAGQFLFTGNNGAGTASIKFGMGRVNDAGDMIKWIRTFTDGSACDSFDIDHVTGNQYALTGLLSTGGLLVYFSAVESGGEFTVTKTWAKTLQTTQFNSVVGNSTGIYATGYSSSSGVTNMGMDDGIVVRYDTSGNIVWQNAFGHDMDERIVSTRFDPSQENIVSVGYSESHSFGRDAILFRLSTNGYGTGLYHITGNAGMPYIYNPSSLTGATDTSSFTTVTPPTDSAGSLVTTGGVFTPFTGSSYTITNSGTNNYIFNGGEFTDASDPTLTLARGGTYTFTMAYSGTHPFWIKYQNTVGGTTGVYNSGITNNGATGGQTLTFVVPEDAPDVLYYRCGNHSGMGGQINIVDNPSLSNDFTTYDYGFTLNYYDGSYGPNGVFMFWLGYLDLNLLQDYLNSDAHSTNVNNGVLFDYTNSLFKFYQVSTVGDGMADDGNIFGYDIIESTDGTVWAIGQTSGDVSKINLGSSGVYDYILFKFDPATETFEYYQNGTSLDEETYALCELADGRIAYTGRTSGDLGSANLGGYDIFLGIFDPNTDTSDYYSIGSGLDDKGINVHDIGNDTLAIVFTTYGTLGTTNYGTEDIGVYYFNYSTGTWLTAYQTGSNTSEITEQNGKPSVLLDDGRIAIVCSSAGTFADDAFAYGLLDMCLAIFDPSTNTWNKFQIGSGASDFASSIDNYGEKLLISGYSRSTFADDETNAVFVEFDASKGIGGIQAIT